MKKLISILFVVAVAAGCTPEAEKDGTAVETRDLALDEATEIDLGDWSYQTAASDGASVFVSAVSGDKSAILTISNGQFEVNGTDTFFADMAVGDDGELIACTGGAAPQYATLDDTLTLEPVGSLPRRCEGSDQSLPCWGGAAYGCAINPNVPRTMAMIEGHGFDDAPESTLWKWDGTDLVDVRSNADEQLLGLNDSGDAITVGYHYVDDGSGVLDSRRQIRSGDEVVADIDGEMVSNYGYANDELEALSWVAGQDRRSANVALFGSDEPIATIDDVSYGGSYVATHGPLVALAATSTNRTKAMISLGGNTVSIPMTETEEAWDRLEGIELTDDAVYVFISRSNHTSGTTRVHVIPFAD